MAPCYLFLVSGFLMTFNLTSVNIFSWVRVAEWPHFRKELLTRFTICSLCILTLLLDLILTAGFRS